MGSTLQLHELFVRTRMCRQDHPCSTFAGNRTNARGNHREERGTHRGGADAQQPLVNLIRSPLFTAHPAPRWPGPGKGMIAVVRLTTRRSHTGVTHRRMRVSYGLGSLTHQADLPGRIPITGRGPSHGPRGTAGLLLAGSSLDRDGPFRGGDEAAVDKIE